MSAQVKGSSIPVLPKPASGSQLYALVTQFRRKGYTASFGVQKDPKVTQR
jgi:hypothetical protein